MKACRINLRCGGWKNKSLLKISFTVSVTTYCYAAWQAMARRLAGAAPREASGIVRFPEIEILLMDQAVPTPLFQAYGTLPTGQCGHVDAVWEEAPAALRVAAGHFPFVRKGGGAIPRSHALFPRGPGSH